MTEPMPEPTDQQITGSTGNLTLTLGQGGPNGPYLCQINGVDVLPGVFADVQEAMRRQYLRQLLAERQVTDLRAERDAIGAVALDYARERDEARAEVERLRGLLGVILGRFTERGHPGWPCLRTGWQKVAEVEQWQREAGLT